MSARRRRDRTGLLWVEQGDARTGLVASVAPITPIDTEYTFAVPDELAPRLQIGHRVTVPLGKASRLVTGFCLGIEPGSWSHTLKPIESLVDPVSYLDQHLLGLGWWISRYYFCPLGRTLNALVPSAVHRRSGFRTRRSVSLRVPFDKIVRETPRLGPKQRAALEYLAGSDGPVDRQTLLAETGVSLASLRSAARRGWIEIITERVAQPAPSFDLPPAEPGFELNAEQRAAGESISAMIDAGCFQVGLLFGVSGSGKTEVYIRAMRRALQADRQVIMLVPEIALTTQLVSRLACRFTDLAVIHSGLSDAQRSLIWTEIAAGNKRVVIGTRSAVFAPCRRLGLIVVDEEQETSFKNLRAPRFHVRDVAVKRGQLLGIPVLLGSATPSLESWTNCDRHEHYHRFELCRRASRQPMPQVQVVDMREEYEVVGQARLLSRLMEQKLAGALDRGEQAILLLNRRGFANWLVCPACRRRVECPRCSSSMVYHAATRQVVCHYCTRREQAPTHCQSLGCGRELLRFGSGTQRAEERLRQRFPGKNIVRVDSDTMRHSRQYQELIDDFEAGRIDILAGTQMIAKGLDFPNVSFVGVIGADSAGASSDFRAGERLFQLMTQVAGRAGRGELPGQVVVQTLNPHAPALQAAIEHDYRRFADAELKLRRGFGYPPFTRLTRIVLSHPREERARTETEAMVERLRNTIATLPLPHAEVLDPQPCVLGRIRGQYRYDLLLRTDAAASMQQLLDRIRADRLLTGRVNSVMVDVDPVSLT